MCALRTNVVAFMDFLSSYIESVFSSITIFPDTCVDLDFGAIVEFFMMYILMRFITRRYQKRIVLSTNIISMLACWYFVWTNDFDTLVAYYWYDLVLVTLHGDLFMILHHCVSLYGLQQCPSHPDHEAIRLATMFMKSGDIFLHYYKLIDALELYNKYPLETRLAQMVSVLVTIIRWMYYRIYKTMDLFPFESNTIQFVAMIFYMLNVMWIIKLCIQLKYITREVVSEWHRHLD